MQKQVTVRTYEGGTTKMVAVETGDKLVYVANPQSLQRIADGLTEPVGVPREDVRDGWGKEAAH